ncbi:hypothetical protein BBK82_21570 [Lentzea guizhouensis]|uniref:Lipoprotein LpqB beta-propeller domain-containing protein n=1 Tax=Lentzea guizhouensis TaxID=1586287 RepID=A0A1B2HKL5_9PSEU|nr:hypothetical protein [Lentzea guizhouensis]ANZ38268.1 hypothetical protein BBK82_21570 [Lentzea guizhouensis]
MRTLIGLAVLTAVAGCATALHLERAPGYTAPNKLVSCHADLPDDWRHQLSRTRTEVGSHEHVSVVAANGTADTTLVKTTRNRTTELVLRDSRKRQQVMAVQDDAQLFDVEFDGRWVTFATTPGPGSRDTTVYAWDSQKDGAPVRISGSAAPVLHNGRAAWADEAGVHLHDLAKKKDTVVGKGEAPAFFGDLLVWTQDGKFRAVRTDRGEAVLPEPLAKASPGASVASDGRTLVWTQDDRLLGWRADWPQARELAEIKAVPKTEGIVFPRVSGDFVSWRSESSYVTDIRSGATMHTSETEYWLEVRGGALAQRGRHAAAAAPLSAFSSLRAC